MYRPSLGTRGELRRASRAMAEAETTLAVKPRRWIRKPVTKAHVRCKAWVLATDTEIAIVDKAAAAAKAARFAQADSMEDEKDDMDDKAQTGETAGTLDSTDPDNLTKDSNGAPAATGGPKPASEEKTPAPAPAAGEKTKDPTVQSTATPANPGAPVPAAPAPATALAMVPPGEAALAGKSAVYEMDVDESVKTKSDGKDQGTVKPEGLGKEQEHAGEGKGTGKKDSDSMEVAGARVKEGNAEGSDASHASQVKKADEMAEDAMEVDDGESEKKGLGRGEAKKTKGSEKKAEVGGKAGTLEKEQAAEIKQGVGNGAAAFVNENTDDSLTEAHQNEPSGEKSVVEKDDHKERKETFEKVPTGEKAEEENGGDAKGAGETEACEKEASKTKEAVEKEADEKKEVDMKKAGEKQRAGDKGFAISKENVAETEKAAKKS